MSLQIGVPLMLVAAILQATVVPYLRIYGGQPDLVAVVALAWAILDRGMEGMVWAFIGGLFLDLLSGAPMGVSSLALVPVAFLIGLSEARVYRTTFLLPLLFAGGGALMFHLIYLLALQFLAGQPIVWRLVWWYVTLPSVLFDMVLIIPALRLLGRAFDALHPEQVHVPGRLRRPGV